MNASALSALILAQFDLVAARALEAESAAARATEAQRIIDAGVGGRLNDGGARVGPEAVVQAEAYLARDPAEHVLDGLSHHVFNVLREEHPGATVETVIALDKLQLLNAVPALLDAEVVWRTAAKSNVALETALGYWDRAVTINPADPLPAKILDVLELAHICTPELRATVVAACTVQQPGPATSALHDAGLDDATYDDVRAVLAGVL